MKENYKGTIVTYSDNKGKEVITRIKRVLPTKILVKNLDKRRKPFILLPKKNIQSNIFCF